MEAKVNDDGLAAKPSPDNAIKWGEPAAFVGIEIEPLRAPAAVGENVRFTIQELAGESAVAHVVLFEKSPVIVNTPKKLSVPLPVLVMVNVCEPLVVLTTCAGNENEAALGLNTGTAAGVPVPLRAITWGLPAASSVSEIVAVNAVALLGVKIRFNEQDAPALSVNEPARGAPAASEPTPQ